MLVRVQSAATMGAWVTNVIKRNRCPADTAADADMCLELNANGAMEPEKNDTEQCTATPAAHLNAQSSSMAASVTDASTARK